MKKIKATKTERYAQHQPQLPQYPLVEGVEYDLPDALADRVVELGGGVPVVEQVETPEADAEELEAKAKAEKTAEAKAKKALKAKEARAAKAAAKLETK